MRLDRDAAERFVSYGFNACRFTGGITRRIRRDSKRCFEGGGGKLLEDCFHRYQDFGFGLFQWSGENGTGGLFVSASAKLFGHFGNVNIFAASDTHFDAFVLLFDGNKRTFRPGDPQTFVDEVFRIGRSGVVSAKSF